MSVARRSLQVVALICTLVVGVTSMAVIVTQTTWFKEWLRGFIVRQAEGQQYKQGKKRVADVYALWKFDSSVQLRLSASNLFGEDYLTGAREMFGTTDQTADTTQATYRYYAARLEVKF